MHGLKSLEDHRTGRNPRDLHKSGEMPTAVSPSSSLEGYITLQGMDNFLNSTDTSHTNKFSILIFFFGNKKFNVNEKFNKKFNVK